MVALGAGAEARAAPADPPTLGERVRRLEALDSEAVALIKGFPKAKPPSAAARARLAAYRALRAKTLPEVALQGDAVMQRALTGLDFSATLQALRNYRAWPTERPELRERPECRAEVGLGRHFARYAAALAVGDELAAMLVLGEYQNALNCLSAWQVETWTDILGLALYQYEAALQGAGFGPSGRTNFRVAVFNLVLLTVDLAKYAGPNAAHRWARSAAPEVAARLAAERRSLFFFDPLAGELIGLRVDAVDPRLADLLRDANIGAGACGFVEMLGAAMAGGTPTCGRGLGCVASGGDVMQSLSRFGGARTPFGLDINALRPTNCAGAGGGGGASGGKGGKGGEATAAPGAAGPFGSVAKGGSIGGCAAAAAVVASWQGSPGSCTLAQGMAKKNFQVGKLPQSRGLPVRGFYGDGGCGDPRAVGNDDLPADGAGHVEVELTEADFEDAKRRSAAWLRSKEGQKYVVKSAQDTLTAAEERERLNHNIGTGGAPFPADRAQFYDRMRAQVAKDGKILAEAAAKAVESAKLGETAESHGAAGYTDPDNNITVDSYVHPNRGTVQTTLEHEVVHVVSNTMESLYAAELTGGPVRVKFSEADDHVATGLGLVDPADPSGKNLGHYVDRFIDLVSEEAEKEMKRRSAVKGSKLRRPGVDGPGACGAAAAAVADFMACRPGLEKPLPQGGGLGPSPGLAPPAEGPNGAVGQAFVSCLQAAGVGVAVGDDGTLRARALATSPTGCAAMKCGAGTAAKVGGAGCQCTGADGIVLPDLLEARLCQQSDACLRPPVLGGGVPNFDARALKAVQEWTGVAPPKPVKP
jgi:hypothetical protein